MGDYLCPATSLLVNFPPINSILYLHCFMVVLWTSISFLHSNHHMGFDIHSDVDYWGQENWPVGEKPIRNMITPIPLTFNSSVVQREEITPPRWQWWYSYNQKLNLMMPSRINWVPTWYITIQVQKNIHCYIKGRSPIILYTSGIFPFTEHLRINIW